MGGARSAEIRRGNGKNRVADSVRHDHPAELAEQDLELINVLQRAPRITWDAGVDDILGAECALEAVAPGLDIHHGVVALRPGQCFGWLHDDGDLSASRCITC